RLRPSLSGPFSQRHRPVPPNDFALAPRMSLWAGQKYYKGRGVERVEVRIVHGKAHLKHVLYLLGYNVINTSVVERHNGTSRVRIQRKVWKTLTFSKATRYHRWMSWLTVGLYNFRHAHSSWQIKSEGQVSHQTPAMAAKLADHIWSTREWLLCPVLGG